MQTSIRTICCKLQPTLEQISQIEETLKEFANACNFLVANINANTNTGVKVKNRFAIHQEFYHVLREKFGLSANLTCRVIARVAVAKKAKEFLATSISYDNRIFSYSEKNSAFSVKLLHSREKIACQLGDFQRKALHSQKPTSATLVKKPNGYYLHVQVKEPIPEADQVRDFLGVDLGIINLATDSEGCIFSGEELQRQRKRRITARRQYQRKQTKSAKRRLRKLSGKQSRFQRHVNHCLSKAIVTKAKALNRGIAMEDLTGLRSRLEKTVCKKLRSQIGNWGFYQLREFIQYKAKIAGVCVALVHPSNTSRTCNSCGYCDKANRPSQAVFCCVQCGHSANADVNASKNIRQLAASDWASYKVAPKVSASESL